MSHQGRISVNDFVLFNGTISSADVTVMFHKKIVLEMVVGREEQFGLRTLSNFFFMRINRSVTRDK